MTNTRSLRLAITPFMLIIILVQPAPLALGQEALAPQETTSKPIITQKTQDGAEITNSSTRKNLKTKVDEFKHDLKVFKEDEINRLFRINRGFSVFFIVSGILLTFLSTVFGAVESQNKDVKKWTRIAIAAIGGMAVFFQALNSAFPVTRKAGAYAAIQAEINILEFKSSDVADDNQLQLLKEEFYKLIRQAGEAESSSE